VSGVSDLAISMVLTVYRILGIYTLMFSTFSNLFFGVYHFSHGATGLVFLGPGLGSLAGIIFSGRISNRIYTSVSIATLKICILIML